VIRTVLSPHLADLLGPDAARLGYVAGAVVNVSALSTGSLLVTLDDDQSYYEAPFEEVGDVYQVVSGSPVRRNALRGGRA
jgi:hypothetical protein